MEKFTAVVIAGGATPSLPKHFETFLPPVDGCMFPRACDPIAYSHDLPCTCCNGTGLLMENHWMYSSQEVECWACGGSGRSSLAYDEEQAYVNALMWDLEALYLHLPEEWPEPEPEEGSGMVGQMLAAQQNQGAGVAA